MYKQIKKEEAIGKTVKEFVSSAKTAQMAIVFTDETFVGLGINRGYKAGPETVVFREIDPHDFGTDLFVHSGLMSYGDVEATRKEAPRPAGKIVGSESGVVTAGIEVKSK